MWPRADFEVAATYRIAAGEAIFEWVELDDPDGYCAISSTWFVRGQSLSMIRLDKI